MTPAQVGDMTLDEVYMMLTDKRYLRKGNEAKRTSKMSAAEVRTSDDGTVAGRAADGTPLRLKSKGKSKARMLMEQNGGA